MKCLKVIWSQETTVVWYVHYNNNSRLTRQETTVSPARNVLQPNKYKTSYNKLLSWEESFGCIERVNKL